jgi:hypothetical protein
LWGAGVARRSRPAPRVYGNKRHRPGRLTRRSSLLEANYDTVLLLFCALAHRHFHRDGGCGGLAGGGGACKTGRWSNDSQHVDLMGAPYLLATGCGEPVADAVGQVAIPEAGSYRLWVRCRDWYPSDSPGQFKVSVGGEASTVVFGKPADDPGSGWMAANSPCGRVARNCGCRI